MRDGGAESRQQEQTMGEAGARGVGCQFTFQTLHSTSEDGLSLEFVSATAGRECNIQDARGGWLCHMYTKKYGINYYIAYKQTREKPGAALQTPLSFIHSLIVSVSKTF